MVGGGVVVRDVYRCVRIAYVVCEVVNVVVVIDVDGRVAKSLLFTFFFFFLPLLSMLLVLCLRKFLSHCSSPLLFSSAFSSSSWNK